MIGFYKTKEIASFFKEDEADFLPIAEQIYVPSLRDEVGDYAWTFEDYLYLKSLILNMFEKFNDYQDIWGRKVFRNPPKKKIKKDKSKRSRITGKSLPGQHIIIDNTYVFWEGPSLFDGVSPTVLIVSGLKKPSDNVKTGPMIQTWILRADMSPMDAVKTGADISICGYCIHRGLIVENEQRKRRKLPLIQGESKERSCYVNVATAPMTLYKAYKAGKIKRLPFEEWGKVLKRSPYPIRIGSYGEPAMLPLWVWEEIVRFKPDYTAYTSLWKLKRCQPYKKIFQASVPNIEELHKARELGWGTYRAGIASEPPVPNLEIICPYEPEFWEAVELKRAASLGIEPRENYVIKEIQCSACCLCSGVEGYATKPMHIFDPVHGIGARHHEKRLLRSERAQYKELYPEEDLEID